MFDVAFSRRMCCSRVCSVSTKPRRPSTSVVSPAMRPGMRRMCSSRAAKKPNDGPPKSSRLPSGCPSPSATSAPNSPGGRRIPSVGASTVVTSRPPVRLAAGASAARSSTAPRKFGCWRNTAATRSSTAASSAAASVAPSDQRDLVDLRAEAGCVGRERLAACGCSPRETTNRSRPVALRARYPADATDDGISYSPALATGSRSAPRSRSGTRTSPAACPARSRAGRACTASGTPSAA